MTGIWASQYFPYWKKLFSFTYFLLLKILCIYFLFQKNSAVVIIGFSSFSPPISSSSMLMQLTPYHFHLLSVLLIVFFKKKYDLLCTTDLLLSKLINYRGQVTYFFRYLPIPYLIWNIFNNVAVLSYYGTDLHRPNGRDRRDEFLNIV